MTTDSGTLPPRPMLGALTGLRAFAAAWVVLYHFRADIKALAPTSEPLWPLLDSGYAGVDVFFVLSGFIIAYTYLGRLSRPRPAEAGRFLWYRLARLYPVHLLTVLMFVFIVTPGGFRDARPDDIMTNLTSDEFWKQLLLIHGRGTNGNLAWNYPAWSISVEWLAYLLFPAAAVGLARVGTTRQSLWGFAAANAFNLVTYVLIAVAGYGGDILVIRILGEFGAGCFLFLLWRERWGAEAPWHLLTPAFAVAAGAVTMAVAAFDDVAPVVAAPFYGGLIYGLALERDALSRFLRLPWLVYAGEASYALYMVHAVVQRFVWEYLPSSDFVSDPRMVRLAILVAYAVLLGLASAVVFEFVERPARESMRRVIARRPRAEVPEAVLVIGGVPDEPVRQQQPAGEA